MGRENTIVTGAAIPKRSMTTSSAKPFRKKTDDKKFVRVIAVDPNSRTIWYEQIINNFSPTGAPMNTDASGNAITVNLLETLGIEELNSRYPKALPEDASQTRIPIVTELVELKSVPDYTSGIRNGQYNRITVYSVSPISTQFTLNDNRVPQDESYSQANPNDISQNLDRRKYVSNQIGV